MPAVPNTTGAVVCVAATVVGRAELNPGVSSDPPDLGAGLTRAQVEVFELSGEPDWGLHPRSIRPEGPETGVAGCVESAERRVLRCHNASRTLPVNLKSRAWRPWSRGFEDRESGQEGGSGAICHQVLRGDAVVAVAVAVPIDGPRAPSCHDEGVGLLCDYFAAGSDDQAAAVIDHVGGPGATSGSAGADSQPP